MTLDEALNTIDDQDAYEELARLRSQLAEAVGLLQRSLSVLKSHGYDAGWIDAGRQSRTSDGPTIVFIDDTRAFLAKLDKLDAPDAERAAPRGHTAGGDSLQGASSIDTARSSAREKSLEEGKSSTTGTQSGDRVDQSICKDCGTPGCRIEHIPAFVEQEKCENCSGTGCCEQMPAVCDFKACCPYCNGTGLAGKEGG